MNVLSGRDKLNGMLSTAIIVAAIFLNLLKLAFS